jgi:hypothetical protein
MLTMLWLYLATNQIINISGAEGIAVWLLFGTLVADVNIICALCDRIRGKHN